MWIEEVFQQIKQNTNIKIYKLEKRMNFRYTLNTIIISSTANYFVSILIIIIIVIGLLEFFFFCSHSQTHKVPN